MTNQQLRMAMEAARTGSITRAAKNLYLSQPNASSSAHSANDKMTLIFLITILLVMGGISVFLNKRQKFLCVKVAR